jgi:hypothetical protein
LTQSVDDEIAPCTAVARVAVPDEAASAKHGALKLALVQIDTISLSNQYDATSSMLLKIARTKKLFFEKLRDGIVQSLTVR